MVPCVTCTTGRPLCSTSHHGGAVKSSLGNGLTAPTNRTWAGRSLRWYSNSGMVGTITWSASTPQSRTNTGSGGKPECGEHPVRPPGARGRSNTFWTTAASSRLRTRPRTPGIGVMPGPPGAVSRARQEQRGGRVAEDGRPGGGLVEQQRQGAQEEGIGEDGVIVVVREQFPQGVELVGERADEDVLHIEVDPRDAGGLGAGPAARRRVLNRRSRRPGGSGRGSAPVARILSA